MGLTAESTGRGAVDSGLTIIRETGSDRVIALAGNPNVGKSTVFNELTGMNQHTGNWPGKTVTSAQGIHPYQGVSYIMVDLPGTYSLLAHSAEEEVARDFICFGGADAAVVVCDATCLERNLNLALQTIEITPNVVVCVNLLDEAKKKRIHIDLPGLSRMLGVPVVGASARSGRGLLRLMEQVSHLCAHPAQAGAPPIRYTAPVEHAASMIEAALQGEIGEAVSARWLALRLLEDDASLNRSLSQYLGFDIMNKPAVRDAAARAREFLQGQGIAQGEIQDRMVSCMVLRAEEICNAVVRHEDSRSDARDRKLDRILTSKATGIPIMLALLCVVFWLTISGANVPSQWLSTGFFYIQERLTGFFTHVGAPAWLHGVLVLGVYRTLAWMIIIHRYSKRQNKKTAFAVLHKAPCYVDILIIYIDPLDERTDKLPFFV